MIFVNLFNLVDLFYRLGEETSTLDQPPFFFLKLLPNLVNQGFWKVEFAHPSEEKVLLVVGVEPESKRVVGCLNFCEFSDELKGNSVVADSSQTHQIETYHEYLN